jgi:hypothetical protein
MAVKTTTVSNQRDDSNLVQRGILNNPLLKLRERMAPVTAVSGRSFSDLVNDASVSLRNPRPEDTIVDEGQPDARKMAPDTVVPIDTLSTGAMMDPAERVIERDSVTNKTAEDIQSQKTFGEQILEFNDLSKEQRTREAYPTLVDRVKDVNKSVNDGVYSPGLDGASKVSVTSFSEPALTNSSKLPNAASDIYKRMGSVVDLVNDPSQISGNLNPVTGLTPRGNLKDTLRKDESEITFGEKAESFRQQSIHPGSIGATLHSLDAVKSVDLGRTKDQMTNLTDSKGVTRVVGEDGKPIKQKVKALSLLPDDYFLHHGAIHAEHYFASTIYGDPDSVAYQDSLNPNKFREGDVIDKEDVPGFVEPDGNKNPKVNRNDSSEVMGRSIMKDYRNSRGMDPDVEISKEEATVVGDFAKTMYHLANPDLVARFESQAAGQQVQYQLTGKGHQFLNDPNVSAIRRRLVGETVKRNRKSKMVYTPYKKVTGGKKGTKFSKESNESVKVLNNTGFILDRNRLGMLVQLLVPFLNTRKDNKNFIDTYIDVSDSSMWKLEALGIGTKKVADIELSIKQQLDKNKTLSYQNKTVKPVPTLEQEYDNAVKEVMDTLKIVMREKDGINYNDHAQQAYSGRLESREPDLNYQANTLIRSIIKGPTKYIARLGNRVEANLRQKYAMMLLDTKFTTFQALSGAAPRSVTALVERNFVEKPLKGGEALPMIREEMLDLNSDKLEAWGIRLSNVFDSDQESLKTIVDVVAQEILLEDAPANEVLSRPSFPMDVVKGRNGIVKLDVKYDEATGVLVGEDVELSEAISSKGREGILFIDALIEFAQYAKWRRAAKELGSKSTFVSRITGHADGKTSGVSILSVLLGGIEMAYLTGVVRGNSIRLTDTGDVRDELSNSLLSSLEAKDSGDRYYGFQYNQMHGSNSGETMFHLTDTIAAEVFSDMFLHKYSIMTAPYGKEFTSMRGDVKLSINRIYAEKKVKGKTALNDPYMDAYDRFKNSNNLETLVNNVHEVYVNALSGVLSDPSLEFKSMSRAMLKLHQAMNKRFVVKSMTGTNLVTSGTKTDGYDSKTAKSYSVNGKKYTSANYTNRETMAPTPMDINTDTGFNQGMAGGDLFSKLMPALIIGAEADVIAKTFSGKSRKRIEAAAGKDAFLLPVFDAIIFDDGTYDTAVREINKNFDSILNYNPLQAILEGLQKSVDEFLINLTDLNPTPSSRQDAKLPSLRKRSDKDILSIDEKEFIVDLLSYNDNIVRETDPDTGEETGVRIDVQYRTPKGKFRETSQFEDQEGADYFRPLPITSFHTSSLVQQQQRAYGAIGMVVQSNYMKESDLTIVGTAYSRTGKPYKNGAFDVSKPHYDTVVATLDVKFLRDFVRYYQVYLFGAKFSRMKSFIDMANKNKAELKKEISKNGYPVHDENGNLTKIGLEYFGP